MNKKTVMAAAAVGASLCALFTACAAGTGKSTLLGSPAQTTSLSYAERTDGCLAEITASTDAFAAKLAEALYEDHSGGGNMAVSPVSVYMALSLAAECAGGATRAELLSALNIDHESLYTDYAYLYRALNREYSYGDKVTARLDTTNSIWLDESEPVNTSCIDALSSAYYAWSYTADFKYDNENANLAVRSFIKEQTRGLIDQDFNLTEETAFALINTLYLKEIWNTLGDDLSYTPQKYDFTQTDGSVYSAKLLRGYYALGRAQRTESFSTFYAKTAHGYKLHFLVPNDGYGIDDVFTAENLAYVSSISDYGGTDDENKLIYYTRCLFPEFSASFNRNIVTTLQSVFGISTFFSPYACDFSNLTEADVYCSMVQHVTKLEVKKGGIEGAAVTVVAMADAADAPDETEYTEVYEDFLVDRAFGFVLTDGNGITLFSGVVNAIG